MAVTVGEGGKVYTLTAAEDKIQNLMKIKHIRWIKPTTAGHGLLINNYADSKLVASATCDVANTDQTINIDDWVNGIYIHTLGSGTVEVRVL